MSSDSLGETMMLTIEGEAPLRQIFGILSDHYLKDA